MNISHLPPSRPSLAHPNTFDASPPISPTAPGPAALGRTRMNSKTWKDDELPGLSTSISAPELQAPVKLEPVRSRSRSRPQRNWSLVKPGIANHDSTSAPTPPPTCPIPEIPASTPHQPGNGAPVIPPRSSSRLARARQASMSRKNSSATSDQSGRRGSQDTITTSSVTSSRSDYSGRHSTTSTAATSVSSSSSEIAPPLKTRGGLSLRKVEEMASAEPFREGFDTRIFRSELKGEVERREFQRRIELALSEVEKLALEESDAEISDGEDDEILAPTVRVAAH